MPSCNTENKKASQELIELKWSIYRQGRWIPIAGRALRRQSPTTIFALDHQSVPSIASTQ